MLDFWEASDAAYQEASTRLDKAIGFVALRDEFSYATLEQIAKKVLLPSGMMDGHFPAHVLYAVHRSLFRDDIGFRPQPKGMLRTGGQYEVSPWSEVRTVEVVRDFVRKHREHEAAKASETGPLSLLRLHSVTALEQFAMMARTVIDLSRKTRQFTVYGTIMPTSTQGSNHLIREMFKNMLKQHDGIATPFILFLESWAALSSFTYTSSLNGIGSEILRTIKRYGDVNLDATTAWTFLQEIGAISPWENRLSFDLKLPGAGRRLKKQPAMSPSAMGPLKDRLKELRIDWGELPVYCIDDPGAHEIDDGISIESTDVDNEYWVHVRKLILRTYQTHP
jgi:hypothetical protein